MVRLAPDEKLLGAFLLLSSLLSALKVQAIDFVCCNLRMRKQETEFKYRFLPGVFPLR